MDNRHSARLLMIRGKRRTWGVQKFHCPTMKEQVCKILSQDQNGLFCFCIIVSTVTFSKCFARAFRSYDKKFLIAARHVQSSCNAPFFAGKNVDVVWFLHVGKELVGIRGMTSLEI